MIKTYILTAIRNLNKRKTYLVLNVLGFSLGVCIAMLMFAYVWDELGYDAYHPNVDRLYRVALTRHFPDRENSYATTPAPLGPAAYEEFPEVESFARVLDLGDLRVQLGDRVFYEDFARAADSTFFKMFGIRMIEGDINALAAPNSLVITQSMNRKYFGNSSGLNQVLEIGDTTKYTINGICEDVPKKSHLKFDMMISLRTFPVSGSNFWGSYALHNYLVLKDSQAEEAVNQKLKDFLEPHLGPQLESILGKSFQEYVEAGNIHDYFLQPIQSIHLNSRFTNELEPNGDLRYVVLFGAIAVLILVIACFNFTNLSTAYSVNRSKEIGVRKVLGSTKKQLTIQYLVESTIIALLATLVSFIIALLLLPSFNQLAGKNLELSDFNVVGLVSFLALLSVLVGIASGLYPALFMSSLEIVKIFKGGVKISNKKFGLRNILVTMQFAASIFIVLATIFIVQQLNFMRDQKLGFEKESILLLDVSNVLGTRYTSFLDDLRNQPGISSASASFHVPGRQSSGGTFQAIGTPATERFLFGLFVTGYDFHETYDMELVAGRYFDEQLASDTASVLINEECSTMIGWSANDALGGEILITGDQSPLKIIGVLKNFHATSLHEPIRPMVFRGVPKENYNLAQPQVISVRFKKNVSLEGELRNLESKWDEYAPGETIRYSFMDSEFDDLYQNEMNFASLFQRFSILAVVISCFGIVGLSFFIAVERIKEIGIRKVMGATTPQVMLILSKDFIMLSMVANVIVWPVAYLLIRQWLNNYAYAASLNVLFFLVTGVCFTLLMLLVTSTITFKAANANPVEAIGRE